MKQFWRMAFVLLLGTGLVLGGFPAVYGQEEEEDKAKKDDMSEFTLEEVVVTSERGEVLVLDRAMTVTGFNAQMVEKMGIQTIEDLQVLVPGLQVGNRTQGGSKGEDDHYYMRGLGSERTINHFSDVAVAVYVDGIWTDQTYGTDGFFDVERIEVARGPQGTTGGRAALGRSHQLLYPETDRDIRCHPPGRVHRSVYPAIPDCLRRPHPRQRFQLPSEGQ